MMSSPHLPFLSCVVFMLGLCVVVTAPVNRDIDETDLVNKCNQSDCLMTEQMADSEYLIRTMCSQPHLGLPGEIN